MNPPLEWILVLAAGLVAGMRIPPGWKTVVALGGLAILFLGGSIAWGALYGISPATVLALKGGQITQLVAVAYICAIACAATAVRAGLGRNHAT